MGIGRADLAFFSSFVQFPGEDSEPRAVRPWVDLQPDRQRARAVIRSVEELMKRGDDGFGGFLQCRKLRQLPGQPDVAASADVSREEKLSCSSG